MAKKFKKIKIKTTLNGSNNYYYIMPEVKIVNMLRSI